MKLTAILLLIGAICSLTIFAAPTEAGGDPAPLTDLSIPSIANSNPQGDIAAPRFTCGQYKFDDGTIQEFYSNVWIGLPSYTLVCRHFKYEFDPKKGQEGKMIGAKVDKGCTCYFYAKPCDPVGGYAEAWPGWSGWQNYAYTDKTFKGWFCREQL